MIGLSIGSNSWGGNLLVDGQRSNIFTLLLFLDCVNISPRDCKIAQISLLISMYVCVCARAHVCAYV